MALRSVENQVEREELIQNAAFHLKTSKEDMAALVDGIEVKKVPEPVEKHVQENSGHTVAVPAVNNLSALERDLLYALMSERDTLPEKILSEPILIEGLHSAVIAFTQNLHDILVDDELDTAEKKGAIKDLLVANGASWVQHWRNAYHLQIDKEVNPIAIFEGCIAALKREIAKRTLDAVEEQIQNCEDDEMRTELVRQKIELLKSGYLASS